MVRWKTSSLKPREVQNDPSNKLQNKVQFTAIENQVIRDSLMLYVYKQSQSSLFRQNHCTKVDSRRLPNIATKTPKLPSGNLT
jgi:hypothetical protein